LKSKLVYLGFVISREGLKMDPKKVREILECPLPRNVFEAHIFHGLANFYRKFIRNFSKLSALIVEIIKKN